MDPISENKNSPKENPSGTPEIKGSILDVELEHPQRAANLSQGERLEDALVRSQEAGPRMRPIKTYQSDVAEAIKKDNVSVIKIALAEKRRQDKEILRQDVASTESKKGVVFLILSTVLIVLGIGTLGYFYFSLKDKGDVVLLNTSKNLIYAEKNVEVNIDSQDFKTIPTSIAALKQEALPAASIENIVVTKNNQGTTTINIGNLGQRKITAQELISIFSSKVPGSFLRSLSDSFMLGLYKDSSSVETFLILQTDSYENAFAGMLQWEKDFERDMGILFSIPDLATLPNTPLATSSKSGASGSTSTIAVDLNPVGPSAFAPKPFEDRLVENRDARILTDKNGKIVFLYSFMDPQTLVFATSVNTFKEVVARTILAKHSK